MGYFKNIFEFIEEFDGTIDNTTVYENRKTIKKTKYNVIKNNSDIRIIKYKGRYELSIYDIRSVNNKSVSKFICESGTWEKIEKELFKLNIFIEFIRDEKLKSILKK